ncbi:fimbrial biogenesis chaperone [Vibrio sp. WXL103]|uniref:fimbrial biogenesis chaperone n=1 Tax=Vibrio sp. WXL103 TaxID=3450710 RepID=UPI003EC6FFAD
MKLYRLLSIVLAISFTPHSHAALALDRTRIIFNQSSDLEVLRVNNPVDTPFLAQSWIASQAHIDQDGDPEQMPFMVVPPVTRVEAHDYAAIRIQNLRNANALPDDRESVFYFHLREIPPVAKRKESPKNNLNAAGTIQLAFESVIKLFYRPAIVSRIKEVDLTVANGLSIQRYQQGHQLVNDTPFHVTVLSIMQNNGEQVEEFQSAMIEPYSQIEVQLPQDNSYQIAFINDYGATVTNRYACNLDACSFANSAR